MLVQDPLSGYLHEVPDAQPHYGGYGGYYGGYDEYVDPSMAEYPGELGLFFLPKLISAITGGGAPPPPPLLPHQQIIRAFTGSGAPPPPGIPFVPPPGIRAYIASVVKDVLAQTQMQPGAVQMAAQGGMYRRQRRRR